jgi:TPR repeat protein
MDESTQILNAKQAAERGDFATAITLLRPLADTGNVDAQYELGYLALTECEMITGREAFACFQAAADQGHPAAMYHLATFPEFEGFSLPISSETQWTLLIAAAEAGNVQAQYDAGAVLATGLWKSQGDVPPDLAAAVSWYRKAAEAGDDYAQFNLATMLFLAEGCTRDVTEGLHWLNAAAAQGHLSAVGLIEDIRESGVDVLFPPKP